MLVSVLLYRVPLSPYLIVFMPVCPISVDSAGRQRVLLTGGNKTIDLINQRGLFF